MKPTKKTIECRKCRRKSVILGWLSVHFARCKHCGSNAVKLVKPKE